MFAEANASGFGVAATSAVLPMHVSTDTPKAVIKKRDEDEQLIYGEVYAPTVPDSHGDFMSRETIKAMAHDFMKRGLLTQIDVQHNRVLSGSYIVESFIARDDDPVFIPGSWVIGVKVEDPALWARVKNGELNGFSLDGDGVRVATEIDLITPDTIEGMTDEAEGHSHRFFVAYDSEGNFLGGYTDTAEDGHMHQIKRGTATETTFGHSHRFSFVEGVAYARVEA